MNALEMVKKIIGEHEKDADCARSTIRSDCPHMVNGHLTLANCFRCPDEEPVMVCHAECPACKALAGMRALVVRLDERCGVHCPDIELPTHVYMASGWECPGCQAELREALEVG